MDKNEILQYFKEKADDYDLVENQVYWRLSDKLLWHALENYVIKKLGSKFCFLDAGGGTGRWSKKVLDNYPESSGLIYDLSADMLRQAEQKKYNEGIGNRLQIIQGDIQAMKEISDETFDIAFNFHNVMGFVASPEKALSEIARVTKKDGYIISFIPNMYHAIYFNIMLCRLDEAEHIQKTSKGRFTNDMPYMHLFTTETIRNIYEKVGINVVNIAGFPSVIYPGMQETQITGSTESLTEILDNENNFDRIYEIEKYLMKNEDIAARGNNLFIVGRKGR